VFTLLNVHNKLPLVVDINDSKKVGSNLEFIIGPMINKRNKDELNPEIQFKLLNSYLEYKGETYKKELYDMYVTADQVIMNYITKADIHPLPVKIVHNVIDHFDMVDIFHYLKDIYRLPPPANLMEVFDNQYESDKLGSRVQTYLKDDYLELAALELVIKAILPIIAHFGYVKSSELSIMHREAILFNFIKTHKIIKTPAMVKLSGLIEKLVSKTANDGELEAIRTIEKQLPKEDVVEYVLAIVILQRVSISPLVRDNANENIVTKVYNYVTNKLKVKADVSKSIRNKKPMTDIESNAGDDKESIIESYRVLSRFPLATHVELDWSVSDIDIIVSQLPVEIDPKLLLDSIQFTKGFLTSHIDKIQVTLLGIIFKQIIDPRGLEQVNIDSIVNLLGVGFAYLWTINHKHLALLLTSTASVKLDTVMTINTTVNRNRISKEIKDALQYWFPYNRVKNATTNINVVEESINEISNNIYTMRWTPLATPKYINEVIEDGNVNKILPADLKLKIAELIIALQEINHATK